MAEQFHLLNPATGDVLFTGSLAECEREWRCTKTKTVIRRVTDLEARIGELCREGKRVFYAILGRAMVESHDPDEVLRKHEDKLHYWDKLRASHG